EAGAALEGLLLTLHVELPARRISLEELSRLRAGQVLELGCRPTDPVELVADGRRVAVGELVDVEGRLGVRVTRLVG
ncbi:MAG TPA: FliM/FliN family flagellar motor C-terminal domain-containing protein, partial [Pyrinomonadaceae bacterium]|nr:FliM/FliN family flagellar motor C-terminal domain-containing protein [Pyrinomonadaceae bacterium]